MSKRRRLVLHFDINKTIIMCDPVKGVDCDAMIGSLLSEVCWGTWDCQQPLPQDAEGKCKAAATWIHKEGPTTEPQPGMITYGELLEEVLRVDKAERVRMKTDFVEEGQPGTAARDVYAELQNALKLPEGVSLPSAPAGVGAGRCFLLPSFLKVVLQLEEEKRDFRIVFRTFGIDILDVIAEFNLFCRGEHPLFPNVPADMKQRIVNLPRDSGEFYRDDAGFHMSFCAKVDDTHLVQMIHGADACAQALNDRLFDEKTPTMSMALRDCFSYWSKNKESDDSGKPLFVEPLGEDAVHHIFFDDNIERDRAHIVDVRRVSTGESLPFADTAGLYLIKAEPLLAIRDPDYFITAVAAAELAFDQRLQKN